MTPLVPVRMLNEVVYCARLFALEHLDGQWADSADTIRGRTVHRRVDAPSTVSLPEPEADEAPRVVRSVELSDERLGMIAKIDLVEADGVRAAPVDYKKGHAPDVPEGAYLPERVQVCAQGLLLRAHGYEVDEGVLYFAGSRRRVQVPLDEQLVAETKTALQTARQIIEAGVLPPPLVDSPKCWGCSLVGICLPDEQNVLQGASERVRPLAPPREEGLPLYVEHQGAKLAKSGGEIVVKVKGKIVERHRLLETSRVVVTGSASVTTPLLQALAEADISLAVHSWSNRLVGSFHSASGHNVLGRIAQHRVSADARRALPIARALVEGKIRNQRVLLRRNAQELPDEVLVRLEEHAVAASRATAVDELLGLEGAAARAYFQHFAQMLRSPTREAAFDFEGRNRRPPRDPVNALLSMAYAFLAREATNVLAGVGLDPWVGFLHRPRPGKPALALDLMEEFRPVLADSVVLGVINNGELTEDDFEIRLTGTSLRQAGRRRFIRAFERRLQSEAKHPSFGTRLSYRRILEIQARLLGKVAMGELTRYPPFRVR